MAKFSSLDELAGVVRGCQLCPLHKTRTQAVPGLGSAQAEVMFVGEAPGGTEDRLGQPFVGPAGKILTQAIEQAGWRREDVYITNLVKCRPPDNRDPLPLEVASCRDYFTDELALLKPLLVVLLGRHALAAVAPKLKISEVHGKRFMRVSQQQWYFPSYHPAATLYSPGLKDVFVAELSLAKQVVEEMRLTR